MVLILFISCGYDTLLSILPNLCDPTCCINRVFAGCAQYVWVGCLCSVGVGTCVKYYSEKNKKLVASRQALKLLTKKN